MFWSNLRVPENRTLGRVGVGDIDRLRVQRAVGRDQGIVWLAIGTMQRQIGELRRNRLAGRAAEGDLQRIRAHDLEMERLLVFTDPVESAAISMSDRFRGEQDVLQQPCDIALMRQGGADAVELLESPEQILHRFHDAAPYLMQTARTCAMSVMPCNTFYTIHLQRAHALIEGLGEDLGDTRLSWISFFTGSVPTSSSCRPTRPYSRCHCRPDNPWPCRRELAVLVALRPFL